MYEIDNGEPIEGDKIKPRMEPGKKKKKNIKEIGRRASREGV